VPSYAQESFTPLLGKRRAHWLGGFAGWSYWLGWFPVAPINMILAASYIVALFGLPEGPDVRFHGLPLYQERFVVALPPDHPLASRRAVRWREVVGEPLVLMQAGTGLRAIADRAFADLGEKPVPLHEVAQVSTAVGLVEAGLGLAILPAYALAASRAAEVAAVPLTEPVVHRDIVAVSPAGRSQSGACEAFLAHFRKAFTESGGAQVAASRRRGPARK
jgi:DNA-binding transcriptional LysR family regulator